MNKGKTDSAVKADTYIYISPEDLRLIADQMAKVASEASKAGLTSVSYRLTDTIVLYHEPKNCLPPIPEGRKP